MEVILFELKEDWRKLGVGPQIPDFLCHHSNLLIVVSHVTMRPDIFFGSAVFLDEMFEVAEIYFSFVENSINFSRGGTGAGTFSEEMMNCATICAVSRVGENSENGKCSFVHGLKCLNKNSLHIRNECVAFSYSRSFTALSIELVNVTNSANLSCVFHFSPKQVSRSCTIKKKCSIKMWF